MKKADIQKLTEEFLATSKLHKRDPTKEFLSKLEAAQVQLNLALTTSAEKHLCWMGARFYYQSNKIGAKTRTISIPKIRTVAGVLSQNPVHIMKTFQNFYPKLYTDISPPSPSKIDDFLRDLLIPKLIENHRELLSWTSPFPQKR